ncbi:MAG: ABC transporter permease subunit [Clostridiales bacterium]|nr:ABC transporter permease subunit [Clostridiales bacterium]
MKKQLQKIAYTFAGAAIIVAVWWIAAAAYGKPLLLPTPAQAVKELGRELSRALFWRSFLASVLRSVLAFVAACLLATLCAYAGKAFAPVRHILAPVVGVLRSVPTMSVILLLVLWVGGDGTPLWVSGLVIFPVLYSGLSGALATIPRELEEAALLYGGRSAYKFFRVYLPLSAPAFLHVAGGAASLTLKLTVAAEVLAQTRNSIGLLMQQTRVYFQIGRLMALTVAVVLASLLLEWILYRIRRAVEY